jgi:hypothetical protein
MRINVNDPGHDDRVRTELRQIRKEFSEQFKGDIDAMARYFQEQESLHPERMSARLPQKAKRRPSGAAQGDS